MKDKYEILILRFKPAKKKRHNIEYYKDLKKDDNMYK